MNLEKEVFDILIDDIMPNRFQPREIFDEEALVELANSIKEHGVIQPIIVRKVGDKYEIVAGERRYRASKMVGKTTIPAIVKNIDDKQTAKIALLENLQRKDLTPIEEAKTYQTILKLDNITQEELAINLGKSQSTIANKLRLLNLDEEVQKALLNGRISERHARSLLNVENKQLQKTLVNKVMQNRLTVRQLDDEISIINGKPITKEDNIQPVKKPSFMDTENIIGNMEKKLFEIEQKSKDLEKELVTIPNFSDNVELDEQPIIIPSDNNLHKIESIVPIKELTPAEKDLQKENVSLENLKESPVVNDLNPINNQENNLVLQPEFNNIYDLRFAINNVRQAVQNTRKFGFDINVEEVDFENIYQITIKIDKNK